MNAIPHGMNAIRHGMSLVWRTMNSMADGINVTAHGMNGTPGGEVARGFRLHPNERSLRNWQHAQTPLARTLLVRPATRAGGRPLDAVRSPLLRWARGECTNRAAARSRDAHVAGLATHSRCGDPPAGARGAARRAADRVSVGRAGDPCVGAGAGAGLLRPLFEIAGDRRCAADRSARERHVAAEPDVSRRGCPEELPLVRRGVSRRAIRKGHRMYALLERCRCRHPRLQHDGNRRGRRRRAQGSGRENHEAAGVQLRLRSGDRARTALATAGRSDRLRQHPRARHDAQDGKCVGPATGDARCLGQASCGGARRITGECRNDRGDVFSRRHRRPDRPSRRPARWTRAAEDPRIRARARGRKLRITRTARAADLRVAEVDEPDDAGRRLQ